MCFSFETLYLWDAASHTLTTPLHITSCWLKKTEKSHPECVKKKGCCQDQSEVSSHRGEQSASGLPGRGTRKRVEFVNLLQKLFNFPPPRAFLARLFVRSLLALRECAAALPRVSPALSSAGERSAQHQGAASVTLQPLLSPGAGKLPART